MDEGKIEMSEAVGNVLDDAEDEARILGDNYIGTDHLLLAMLRKRARKSVAYVFLHGHGMRYDEVLRDMQSYVEKK